MALATAATETLAPGSAAARHSALVGPRCSSEKMKKAVGPRFTAILGLLLAERSAANDVLTVTVPAGRFQEVSLILSACEGLLYFKMGQAQCSPGVMIFADQAHTAVVRQPLICIFRLSLHIVVHAWPGGAHAAMVLR